MSTAYVYLALAIVSEVIATSSLKAAAGFTRLGPSVLVVLGYGASFWFLSRILETIPLGIAYAVWSGLGIVLIALAGLALYGQRLDLPAVLGMAMIVGGVLVIHLFSKSMHG